MSTSNERNMATDAEPPDKQLDTPTVSEIESFELFRRSPHPYHRRRIVQTPTNSSSTHLPHAVLSPSDRAISDEDSRKRRKESQSPSESGTEADDEGYGFVKALPAPPIRPRKGLRDVRGTGLDGGVSPLLTPPHVDEEGRRLSAEFFKSRKNGGSGTGDASPTEEARTARQKYLKRRYSEMIRRTTETALLGAIGIAAVKGCCCRERLLQWYRGQYDRSTSTRLLGCFSDIV